MLPEFFLFISLFPFDRARRLGGDIVDYAIDLFHFIDDTAAHFVEDFPWEADVVGGHTVGADDGADAYGVIVGVFVAHDTYTAEPSQIIPAIKAQAATAAPSSFFQCFIPIFLPVMQKGAVQKNGAFAK